MQTYFGTDPTPIINYTPQTIDEYIVVVNLPEDWEEVHQYIINENEIDGIPNRKINCSNDQPFSLRTSIYEMSVAEAEILKTHNKVECVELNPEKYPQPESLHIARFGSVVQFNKPSLPRGSNLYTVSSGTTNGVRSNWALLCANHPSSKPFKNDTTIFSDAVDRDVQYAIKGNNVDAVIIDTGVSVLHPEFISSNGDYRVRDVILDGPMKVDPDAFSAYTETITIDGVNIGSRAQEARARSWWSNTSVRSTAFQSLGTINPTNFSNYTRIHAHSKNLVVGVGTLPITNNHGTCCASQIGGKHHGFAFECNLWNIRISLGASAGGFISAHVALNACNIWHQAKKIASNDPDPTIINNSYGGSFSTGNTNGTTYYHTYRGSDTTYTGSGNVLTVPSGHGTCRNGGYVRVKTPTAEGYIYSSIGRYLAPGSAASSSAENAIAAGCIVIASAGNENQKLSDKDDVDFNNKYKGTNSSSSGIFINRVGGVQQGFSGDHEQGKGSIRVGAIDCGVEPSDEKQGVPKHTLRKTSYSNNGPMIDIYAPAEQTMAAAYASGENYARSDNSNFYDTFFGGTSSAGPNTVGVAALFLEKNRSANQDDVRSFLTNEGCKTGLLSDPFPGVNDTGYHNIGVTNTPAPTVTFESYNTNGSGNLRGSPNRILFNCLSSSIDDNSLILKISEGALNISGTLDISSMNIS